MGLNDQLLRLNEKINYYTFETFNEIPAQPGVYAWFYPLRIRTNKIDSFINDISNVFNFYWDTENNKVAERSVSGEIGWRRYEFKTMLKKINENSKVVDKWKEMHSNPKERSKKEIDEIKKIVFISSIFMPPLYIGKSNNLYNRCQQHVRGGNENDSSFHNRFEKYAEDKNLSHNTVQQLIFACIRTGDFKLENDYENLIETILIKSIKPIYSIK
ncbi:MAG: hypothetical protein K9K32_00490 [Halanaerobiales bacterium]|nr:hypothetical protein [Halanaerobiales bacterium]MCF8008215.1 hypothetical protein [Halanaerobiales bacterium]